MKLYKIYKFGLIAALIVFVLQLSFVSPVYGTYKITVTLTPTSTETPTQTPTPTQALPTPRPDLTKDKEEVIAPLEKLVNEQEIRRYLPFNPIKLAIRKTIEAGISANTIVLLLLLPAVAAIIASARHFIGLRGFGIFLPAALSVVFLSIGPILGILLFLLIVSIATATRLSLRKFKIKLQYLPRMSLILLFVVIGVLAVLFSAPVVKWSGLSNISIFPVLILVLLAEDFSKVQLGKSINTAVSLTTETLLLALVSYLFLTLGIVQRFALLNPELLILLVLLFDFVMGKYSGLRLIELWRFRKIITR